MTLAIACIGRFPIPYPAARLRDSYRYVLRRLFSRALGLFNQFIINHLPGKGNRFPLPPGLNSLKKGSHLKVWGIDLTESGLVKVDSDMKTNRPGIFACGDVIDYDGKFKQIITACGEAATAINSAYKFVKKPYWA